jgi:hypothetical protein
LLQQHRVAYRLYPHQAQTACKHFILRHRELFGWHLVSQTCAFLVAIRHDRFFHATVDLRLRAIRGTDKPIEARELQSQTNQATPTGANLDTPPVERQDQAMQAGETGDAVKKGHDR